MRDFVSCVQGRTAGIAVDTLVFSIFQPKINHLVEGSEEVGLANVTRKRIPRIPARGS